MSLVSSISAMGRIEEYTEDPKTTYSWYLDTSTRSALSIDVGSVWEDYTGAGIRVGVLDSQIDFTHEELAHAYDQSLDFDFSTNSAEISFDPRALTDFHGTMVAGIISAQGGNGVGTVGLAPGAKLVGYGINYADPNAVEHATEGLRAAVSLDVINNSWSFSRNFADNFHRAEYQELAETLQYLAEEGRDGLGTNIVFSAGNAGASGSSNYHNLQNSPYTIAVGAIDRNGDVWSSSSLGANVLVSAGGAVVMTTQPNDRYSTVSGTSFAAPAVSSVIALMLEANPELGYRDVQQILALSAERFGLSDDPLHGDGWRTTGTDTFNGGGMHYSDGAGFGFVNAHNAVRLAETWTLQQTAETRDTFNVTETIGAQMVAGETDHVSYEINVTQNMRVEHVRLQADIRWPNTGDIDLYLTSPDGTQVRLVYDVETSHGLGGIRSFTFTSVASMGEMAAGAWRVDIYNREPDVTDAVGDPVSASVGDVTLTLHGNADALVDDTYVYTDEFGVLYEAEDLQSRRQLADVDGGIDAINAAAVTSDSEIDLRGGGHRQIAGVVLDLQTPAAIENIFAGDGDDTLAGSDQSNVIVAGRGDDLLYYTAGSDHLDGGAGTDRLVFEGSFASLSAMIGEAGAFSLGLLDMGLSLVENIEYFQFSDVTYGFDDLWSMAVANLIPTPGAALPPEPEETPLEPETPEDPSEEPGGTDASGQDGAAGTGSGDVLRGSRDNDLLSGLAGDDSLNGLDGDDQLDGGAGEDVLKGGAGSDVLLGGAGEDHLMGGIDTDELYGGAGDDRLFGGAGDDTISGGEGQDILTGQEGADVFLFSLGEADAVDVIRDFDASEGDRIVVSGLSGSTAGSVSLEFVPAGARNFLEANIDGTVIRLARLDGVDIESLNVNQLSQDSFELG